MVTKLTIKNHTDSHFPDFYWTHPKFKATSYNITLPMESFFSAEETKNPYQAVCNFIGNQFQILTF